MRMNRPFLRTLSSGLVFLIAAIVQIPAVLEKASTARVLTLTAASFVAGALIGRAVTGLRHTQGVSLEPKEHSKEQP